MARMGKKKKQTPEEAEAERSERLKTTLDNMNMQLIKLDRVKKEYAAKAAEADAKGLKSQQEMARKMVGKCIAQEKQVSGMVMTIELALQTKELSSITASFLSCMKDISGSLSLGSESVNTKKAEEDLIKASYAIDQQEDALDQMLDAVGNFGIVGSSDENEVTEYDDEIDALIKEAARSTPGGTMGTNRNRF